MNSGVGWGFGLEVKLADEMRALVIPARKIEMMAPRVPPHASVGYQY